MLEPIPENDQWGEMKRYILKYLKKKSKSERQFQNLVIISANDDFRVLVLTYIREYKFY